MTTTYVRERTLQDEIAPAIEARVSGAEVPRSRALSPSRFCVYIDHPDGVDHALCARVTRVLDEYRVRVHDRRIVARARPPATEARALRRPRSARGRRYAPPPSRRAARGELNEAGEESITLKAGDAGEIRIPYESIVRSNLIDEGLTT